VAEEMEKVAVFLSRCVRGDCLSVENQDSGPHDVRRRQKRKNMFTRVSVFA
jgi:hypothetical protein